MFKNFVACMQGWVSRFRDDKTGIIYVSSIAFKAASHFLSLKAEENKAVLAAAAQQK